MATLSDALGKSKADTLYSPHPSVVETLTLVYVTAPTFNLGAGTFTIPTVTGVDYYEWRGINGFVLVTGTVTRSTSDDSNYPKQTRIQARARTGFVLSGKTTFLATYP